jgi:regulator of protease activity HflC (stomatin/prohibitin superfamily)
MIIVVIVVAVALNAAAAGMIFVPPDQIGVVISALPGEEGVRDEPLSPGLTWVVPFFENVVFYTISTQTYTMSIAPAEGQITGDDSVESRTSDGQIVFVDASVIFKINPARVVNDIHIQWQGGQYVDLLVRPQVRGIIRDAVSRFGVAQVYSESRPELTQQIHDELTDIFDENGLILVDFVLRNIGFSPEYSASIERKQIQEQEKEQAAILTIQRQEEANQAVAIAEGQANSDVALATGRAEALVIAARAEADARLIRAAAEATALELLGAAIAENPDVLLLEYISKLADNINVMLLPSDNPFLLPLPELNQVQD